MTSGLQETSLLSIMGGALYNLFEFLEVYNVDRCNASTDIKTGDIVVCFGDDGKVKCLGTIKHAGHQTLCKDHADGEYGEVFVLPYYKAKVRKGTPLNRKYLLACCLLSCLLLLYSLHNFCLYLFKF